MDTLLPKPCVLEHQNQHWCFRDFTCIYQVSRSNTAIYTRFRPLKNTDICSVFSNMRAKHMVSCGVFFQSITSSFKSRAAENICCLQPNFRHFSGPRPTPANIADFQQLFTAAPRDSHHINMYHECTFFYHFYLKSWDETRTVPKCRKLQRF